VSDALLSVGSLRVASIVKPFLLLLPLLSMTLRASNSVYFLEHRG
jgi:hypothetical protein